MDSICRIKICEANSNGTLQITIPKRAADALGWKVGDELAPIILNAANTPFAIAYHREEGTNGYRLSKHIAEGKCGFLLEVEEVDKNE